MIKTLLVHGVYWSGHENGYDKTVSKASVVSSLVQLRDQRGQGGLSSTLYSTLRFEKQHFLHYCVRRQQTDNAYHAIVYMYSLLCAFLCARYCNTVDFISMAEAQMEEKREVTN